MQGLNEALASLNTTNQVQNKPVKADQNNAQNEQDDSFYKMIENSVKEYESSQNRQSQDSTSDTTKDMESKSNTQSTSPKSQKSSKNDNIKNDKIAQNISQTTNQNPQSIDEIMLENADFITLLGLLESQNGSMKTGISNLVSANLNKFLATEKNIKELKGAKSLQDLLNLSEKFGLGLSKIKITKDGLEALKGEFKNLHSKGFFNNVPVLKNPIEVHAMTKKDIEKTIQKIENSDKNLLSKLMLGQSVEVKKDNKTIINDDEIKSQAKIEPKTEAKIDLKDLLKETFASKDDNKKSALNEQIKPDIKPDIKTQTVQNLSKDIQNIEQKTQPNLTTQIDNQIKESIKQPTTQASTKSQNISSIDEYLANIMQKAIKESGEQSAKPTPATIIAESMSSSNDSNLSEQSSQNFDQNSQSNTPIKDIVNSAKLNAKELNLKHVFDNFATQLQEKISEYKPPITRFHLTLNPGNLGEVEITLINRGSNLHINFNSNNQTMQLFMQHQAEFKASLVNMGFSELSMNFSDNANKEQNQGENKRQKFNINEDEQIEQSQSEETVLEVVLPKYF